MTLIDYKTKDVKLKVFTTQRTSLLRLPRTTEKVYNVGWAVRDNDYYTDMNEELLTFAGAMIMFRKAIRQIKTNRITFCLVD